MSFSLEFALANAEAIIKQRRSQQARRLTYVLYYANNPKRYDGKVQGYTVKELIQLFRTEYSQYKYAFIAKIEGDKVVRYYNAERGKKFFALTRTRKVK